MKRVLVFLAILLVPVLTSCGSDTEQRPLNLGTVDEFSSKFSLAVKRLDFDAEFLPLSEVSKGPKGFNIKMGPNMSLLGSHEAGRVTQVAAFWVPSDAPNEALHYAMLCTVIVEFFDPSLAPQARHDILQNSGLLKGQDGKFTYHDIRYSFSADEMSVTFNAIPAP